MIISTENAEHYTWGDQCDGWHLLQSDTLSVIQERMPPGTSEHLHFHNNAQQLFYILSGTATFELDADKKTLNAGQSIHIGSSVKHRVTNSGKTDLHLLVVSEPKAHGDRVNVAE